MQRLAPFDLVIVDPPSYQGASFTGLPAYQKLVERLPRLLSATGSMLWCSNDTSISNQVFGDLTCPKGSPFVIKKVLSSPEEFIEKQKSLKIFHCVIAVI